jgi:phospholipid N-methyltransferase
MTIDPAAIVAQRRQVLEKLQPVKALARQRAEALAEQKRSLKETGADREKVGALVEGHNLDLFPTPVELARRMVAEADLGAGLTILEPSAGTGRILDAIREAGYTAQAVELSWNCAQYLTQHGYTVTCGDFLEYHGSADRILMNPPFSHGQDIDHVLHAFELLNPGGRIVAIMSEGTFYRGDLQARTFRGFLEGCGYSEPLPDDTFKSSGTQVRTRLVIIDR